MVFFSASFYCSLDKVSLSVLLVLTVQETRYQLAVRETAVLELILVYLTMMEGPALSV